MQMRAHIAEIADGIYRSKAFVDSDGVVERAADHRARHREAGDTLTFDFAGSSPPCAGPMNSVLATTLSSVYLAMRHIFPDVPISAGAFEPLIVKRPEGTFLDAKYPRPVSGCAAEVSQRIAEAVFAAMVQALPDKVTAAPAGSSGNFALGGHDPARGRDYVMYQISGGGYGGNADHDGLTNGCSTIGISKSPPVEIMEQAYPVLYRHYALREGSGGAGKQRGGFGLAYEVEILRGEARASFVMDHGRFGPQGACGGGDGTVNTVTVVSRRRGACAAASVQGAGHPADGRRPRAGRHAGRRRLWRSADARSGTGAARRCDGLLHGGRSGGEVRRRDERRTARASTAKATRKHAVPESDCSARLSDLRQQLQERRRLRAATAAPASRR